MFSKWVFFLFLLIVKVFLLINILISKKCGMYILVELYYVVCFYISDSLLNMVLRYNFYINRYLIFGVLYVSFFKELI